MKSLLQINTNVGWNSTGRIIEDIGKLAIERGWLSTIAYGRNVNGAPASLSKLVRIGNARDIFLHGVGTRLFDRHGLYSHKATLEFIKRIEEIRPDIIHLHNIHGYYINFQDLFAYLSRTGIPVVWTLHDCWSFTGHCAYFDIANCDKWLNGCSRCPLKGMYPASNFLDNSQDNYRLKRKAFTSVDNMHIVTVSRWLKNVVEQSFLDKFPAYVIHNGIEMPSLPSRRVKRERLILGAASKWDARKGLNIFLELRKRIPSDIRMALIGLSPSQIRSLPAGIDGIERINERNILNNWYARAAVFVNPSLSDNLSTTNLEAQACGTPVVTFNVGGLSETVSPGSGIIVDANDMDALTAAVTEVIASPNRFKPEVCREFINKQFNKKRNFRSYFDLYDSILAARDVVLPELSY